MSEICRKGSVGGNLQRRMEEKDEADLGAGTVGTNGASTLPVGLQSTQPGHPKVVYCLMYTERSEKE